MCIGAYTHSPGPVQGTCPQSSLFSPLPGSRIYCYGELLHQVQMAKLYQDDKQFVDMPLSSTPDRVLAARHNHSIPTPLLRAFIQEHFQAAGQELQPWTPEDWKDSPRFLQKISDPKLRIWGEQLHQLWKKLGKKVKPEVLSHPEQFSLLYSEHPFVVPGGRFVEFYYWVGHPDWPGCAGQGGAGGVEGWPLGRTTGGGQSRSLEGTGPRLLSLKTVSPQGTISKPQNTEICERCRFDYDLENRRKNLEFYPSNLSPLWSGCFSDPGVVDKALKYLEDSQILTYQYGIPTSLQKTGQQWDFPSAWAPLQDLVIRGLAKCPSPRAQEVAFQLAQNWIRTNFEVYSRKSAMHEKYDISNGGQPGGGGEYEVQEGFGWTSGVVLMLLDRYGHRLSSGTQTAFLVPQCLTTALLLSLLPRLPH
ncbi:low quality protein: trehalase [Lynx pardinus]|uniref:Trehalase n=1 Tax=Lynx pardinus TaxID=191816 RepID=A0A485NFR4_LYNPA|nr:low quality protein: trehalase [Lynx pardinus]